MQARAESIAGATDSAFCEVPDPAWSLARGRPLDEERGLGTLTLTGFLEEVCSAAGTREALCEHLPDGSVLRWSYAELCARAWEVARALVAAGLGKGERVGVLMTNRAEFVAAVFGVALAGGVAVPLSTFSTSAELEYLLGASAVSVLLAERTVLRKDFVEILCELEPMLASGSPGAVGSGKFPFLRHAAVLDLAQAHGALETWDGFLARGRDVPDDLVAARAATVTPADTAVLFFSSGSTSKPKGIFSAHRAISVQMWRMGWMQHMGEDARYWSANGFFWSGNFALTIGGTLAAGGTIVLQRTFDPSAALSLFEAERVSFIFAWPHQWEQLIEAPEWASTDLSALTHIDRRSPIAAHPTIRSQYLEMRHCYGNTETFTLNCGFPAQTPPEVANGSAGPPLPGNTVKIVDPLTGETLPMGERGEIAIKGPTLMQGYLGVPLDETLDETGFFRTGDGGYLTPEGLVHWEGRINDIIKTGGANVSPLEIDETILKHPKVRLSQTVGVPHDTLGELVVTCVIARDGESIDEASVRAFAKERLASFKVPRRVLVVSDADIELTGTNKVKTAELRKFAAERLAAG